MIQRCSCRHSSQDKLHGKGRRVFNEIKNKIGTMKHYRCTVCKRETT